jgi:hypothetical protein
MGKFYELFEMDAHDGAKELDLQYMKARTAPKAYAYSFCHYYLVIQTTFFSYLPKDHCFLIVLF